MTDEAIIGLLMHSRDDGIRALADQYEKLLIHIVVGILGGRPQDVEECVNDTYLKFWSSMDSFDAQKASLKTYLKVIARNTALNRLRDLSRKEETELPADLSEIAKEYADQSRNVEAHILKQEDFGRLGEIIRGLNERDRELVIRKYFYLQSSGTIARALGISRPAVDTRLSRLRVRMKREFEKE